MIGAIVGAGLVAAFVVPAHRGGGTPWSDAGGATPVQAISTTTWRAPTASDAATTKGLGYHPQDRCPVSVPEGITVDCGELVVPEDRAKPDGRRISLAVARIHSRDPHPAPDPVVEVTGGPGVGSLTDLARFASLPLVDHRDLILWDQRGTGHSTPKLSCPGADLADRTSDATQQQVTIDTLRSCARTWRRTGVDLVQYNSVADALDLAELRRALGIASWNVRSISYGTSVAQQLLRVAPEGVRTVLLDSPIAPDAPLSGATTDAAFLGSLRELDTVCRSQPGCHDRYGDIVELEDRAEQHVATALPVQRYRLPDGKIIRYRPSAEEIHATLHTAAYNSASYPTYLRTLQAMAIADDPESLGVAYLTARSLGKLPADRALLQQVSMVCADRRRTEAHAAVDCRAIGVGTIPAAAAEPLGHQRTPILVAAGRFDPVLPPARARTLAKELGARLLDAQTGHGVTRADRCTAGVYEAFLDHPDGPLAADCARDLRLPTLG